MTGEFDEQLYCVKVDSDIAPWRGRFGTTPSQYLSRVPIPMTRTEAELSANKTCANARIFPFGGKVVDMVIRLTVPGQESTPPLCSKCFKAACLGVGR